MDLALIIKAIFLGIVEGVTEFLPISSTGHLILLVDILGFKSPEGKVFEVAIQLGAILAICFLYWQKLFSVATHLKERRAQRFVFNILVAFLPAMFLGAIFHSAIKEYLFNPVVVSVALVLGGIAILITEKIFADHRYTAVEDVPLKTSLAIGFMQCLAMIPGVSRSGSTIISARLLGLEKKTAAEFSFFLAIPTMFAATVYDCYKNRAQLTLDDMEIVAIGFVTAFIVALFVVKALIKFLTTHGFTVFGWYRIILGSAMLAFFFLR